MTTIELRLTSPRRTLDSIYQITLNNETMEVELERRKAILSLVDDDDPKWSKDTPEIIMRNDHIYPPTAACDLLKRAWLAWRDGELNDEQVTEEFQLIGDWINATTKAQPTSDFWRKYF